MAFDPILADVVWPALDLEGRILSWYAIGAGLVVEYFVLRKIIQQDWLSCILADIVMNAVSTLTGYLLIPIAGLLLELFPGLLIQNLFDTGTYNIGTWILTVFAAAFVNALIEMCVLRQMVGKWLERKKFLWLYGANVVSVAVAFVSLIVYWPE